MSSIVVPSLSQNQNSEITILSTPNYQNLGVNNGSSQVKSPLMRKQANQNISETQNSIYREQAVSDSVVQSLGGNNSSGISPSVSGVNVNVSEMSAPIYVSQAPITNSLEQTSDNSNSNENANSVSPFSVKDILNINDIHHLDGVIKHLHYVLKIAEAKRIVLEAQEAVKAGVLK